MMFASPGKDATQRHTGAGKPKSTRHVNKDGGANRRDRFGVAGRLVFL